MSAAARVVQVCQELSPASGGTTTSVLQFRDALGGSIVAFQSAAAMSGDGSVTEVACASGLAGRAFGWAGGAALDVARDVVAGADLIVCHMLYQYHIHWGAAAARRLGIPYWVVPHGSLDPYVFSYRAARKRAWLAAGGRQLLRRADRVIFATSRERDKAAAVTGSLTNASVVPWPVARATVQHGASSRAEARDRVRRELGLAPSQPTLLYLGRLHSMKRPLETIRVVGEARNTGVALIVAGPEGDISREECTALRDRHGWTNVHVVGPVFGSAKDDVLAAVDGFISLSWRENFGHAVAESLAAGLPVILGPGVDLAGELTGVDCGWLLDGTELQAAGAAVRAFASTPPSRLREMGTNGRAWTEGALAPGTFARTLRSLAAESIRRNARD